MHRATDARIEAVDGSQQFQGLTGHRQGMSHQRLFISARLTFCIAGAGVPGAGHYRLIIFNQAIPDLDPVRQRPTRRFSETRTLSRCRPGFRIPFEIVEGIEIAGLDVELKLENASRKRATPARISALSLISKPGQAVISMISPTTSSLSLQYVTHQTPG